MCYINSPVYKFVLSFAIIFTLTKILPGQGNIEDLKKVIHETEDDSIKALTYNQITWSYFSVNVDSSLFFAEKAFELSTEINNKVFIAAALKSLGRCYVMKNQYSLGIHYLNQALEIDEQRGNDVAKSATLMSMAIVYRRMNKHKMALELDTISLRITREYADKWFELNGEHDRYAILNTLFSYNNTGLDYLNLKEFDIAQTYFEAFKSYMDEKNLSKYQYLYYENMGRLFYESGKDPEKAIAYNLSALKQQSKQGDYLYLGMISNALGKIYLDRNEMQLSKKYLDLAYAYSDSAKTREFLNTTYEYYASYYSKMGNYRLALDYKNKYIELTDSIFTSENNGLIAEYEVMFETVKKEKRIEILEREKEIQRLVNLNQYIIILIISILILLLIIYFVYRVRRFRKEKQKMKEEILLKDKELTNFALFLAKKNENISRIRSDLEKQKDFSLEADQSLITNVVKDLNQEVITDSWDEFEKRFNIIHPGFFKSLKLKHENLNQNDLKMCSLLRLNMSSKEIASLINITPPSVDVSRSRLRKKLNIPTKENLVEYLITF